MSHPPLPMWDIKTVNPDGRLFIFEGQHGSGKTTLLRHVVNQMTEIQDWIAYSPTQGGYRFFSKMFTPAFTYNFVPTDENLQEIMDKQKLEEDLEIATADLPEGDPNKHRMRVLGLVIDDCGSHKKLMRNSPKLKELLMNQRHMRIHIFITLQYICQFDPENYSQVDYMFILNAQDPQNMKVIYEKFAKGRLQVATGTWMKRREEERLQHYLQYYTRKGCALVVDKTGTTYLQHYTFPKDPECVAMGDEMFQKTAREHCEDKPTKTTKEIEEQIRRQYYTRFVRK